MVHFLKSNLNCVWIYFEIVLGARFGLRLTLNIEQYEYMIGPNTDAGLKVGFISLKYLFGRNENIVSQHWILLIPDHKKRSFGYRQMRRVGPCRPTQLKLITYTLNKLLTSNFFKILAGPNWSRRFSFLC